MIEKVAIIDLGTNTFHLLIAEIESGKTKILHREKVGVKLGKAGINDNLIQTDAIHRAIATLQNFKAKMDELQVSKVSAFGTSALRNAKNAVDVTSQIKAALVCAVWLLQRTPDLYYQKRNGWPAADCCYDGKLSQ